MFKEHGNSDVQRAMSTRLLTIITQKKSSFSI